jgi:seryl-tRNA synthetase
MLGLDFICQHHDIVRDALQKRCETHDGEIDEILLLAERRRGFLTQRDRLRTDLKIQKEAIHSIPLAQRSAANELIKARNDEIRMLELQIVDLDTRLQFLLLLLPNIPHESVRVADAASSPDEVVSQWGELEHFHFEPQAHWDLGARLGILDAEMGVRIAGSRFVLLKGAGARLERALISFMLDVHTREHGYMEVLPPQLVKRSVMVGAGQLPKFEDQVYSCREDELYLNPTAEVPLVGMHSDAILSQDLLPLRYVAWTTAFRREAGSASHQTRGLLRLHQFNKVELFQYTEPQDSYDELAHMLQHAEAILQLLELAYRVVALNSAHLPFSAAKTFDIEVWMPGMKDYVEISSVSNCEGFQARRANIRYRGGRTKRAAYVHTLNGSGLAVGRTLAAILENYQQADGSVVVPKVLRPYVGTSILLAPA